MNKAATILIGIFSLTFIHWVLVQLYYYFCVGKGILGFLYSFITLGSPVCQFMNFIQFEISKQYILIWTAAAVSLLAWLMAKLKL